MGRDLLRIISGAASGTEVPLNGDFVVGRGEDGLGKLGDDTEISRRHARFTHGDDGSVVLEDLGSTNGTFVNGKRVVGPTTLSHGDEVRLGRTRVQFEREDQLTEVANTTVRSRPTEARVAAAAPGATAAAPPPAKTPPATPPKTAPRPAAGGPVSGRPEAVGPRGPRLVVDALILLACAAAFAAITFISDKDESRSTADANCGSNIGNSGPVAFVSYTLSNITSASEGDKNSVLAVAHRPGDFKATDISQCYTDGSGATQLKMPGTVDGNDQIVVNPQHTLLFAVNQGSDSIAVFHINSDGSLKKVDGSPFPSGGKAPASLGLTGSTLLVANKARDGVRNLDKATPNYTSFKVAADGKLTQVPGSNIPSKPMSLPSSAVMANTAPVGFGLADGNLIHSFTIDPAGALKEAPGSPITAPPSAYPPGTPPPKQLALGVRAHPTKPFVYMALPTVPALAVYSYDKTGKLTFLRTVPTVGAFLPCWIQITRDGHWLYTSSAASNDITAYDISDPARPKQIQNLPFMVPGNSWNIQLDPTDHYLFAVTPRAVPAVPLMKGNLIHVMKIGPDGRLTEVTDPMAPVKLPVPTTAAAYGLAVVQPRQQ